MFDLQLGMRGRRVEQRVEARRPRWLGRQLARDHRLERRRAVARHRLEPTTYNVTHSGRRIASLTDRLLSIFNGFRCHQKLPIAFITPMLS